MAAIVVTDTGAGNVKIIAADDGKVFKRFLYPSAAALETYGALSSFHPQAGAAFEVRPKIDGTTYIVSLRPNQQIPDGDRTVPSDDYQASKPHDALVAAGLHHTGLTRVDVLVMGAPVHTFQKHAAHLKNRWTGTFDFGLKHCIEIKKVLVVPQPYGSLVASINEHILERGEHVNHCIIDAGYFSSDVLITRGLSVNKAKSFGSGFGTAAVYQKIADMLSTDLRLPVNDLDRIEYALRTGTPYSAHGQTFDLNRSGYLDKVNQHIEAHVSQIYARLGTTEDISTVLLTGGGSTLFQSAVRKVFRSINVQIMPDPVHANARGYLIAGQSTL